MSPGLSPPRVFTVTNQSGRGEMVVICQISYMISNVNIVSLHPESDIPETGGHGENMLHRTCFLISRRHFYLFTHTCHPHFILENWGGGGWGNSAPSLHLGLGTSFGRCCTLYFNFLILFLDLSHGFAWELKTWEACRAVDAAVRPSTE